MLYREIIDVCSGIHTKHINTLCRQKVELLSMKPDGTYTCSKHWTVKFKPMVSTAERAAQNICATQHCQTVHPLYHYFNKTQHPPDNPKTASAFPRKSTALSSITKLPVALQTHRQSLH
jgi:hypothetical protein